MNTKIKLPSPAGILALVLCFLIFLAAAAAAIKTIELYNANTNDILFVFVCVVYLLVTLEVIFKTLSKLKFAIALGWEIMTTNYEEESEEINRLAEEEGAT